MKSIRKYLKRRYLASIAAIFGKPEKPQTENRESNDIFDGSRNRVLVRVSPSSDSASVLKLVQDALSREAIPYLKGNLRNSVSPSLLIDGSDYPKFINVLESIDFNTQKVEFFARRSFVTPDDLKKMEFLNELKLIVVDRTVDHATQNFSTYSPITIFFGKRYINHLGVNMIEVPVVNPYVKRLRIDTFLDLGSQGYDLSLNKSMAMNTPSFPVDVVYTWVNDQDQKWQNERDLYSNAPGYHPRSNDPNRFKSRDEIKYSLRSIEMFAPFVRNVYLVTNGQVPDWLNLENERLILVSHDEIYRDKDCLPTFNSNSIESHLHNIENLSEQYLYMNDDVFLGTICTEADFFLSNGCIKFFPSPHRVFEPDIAKETPSYLSANLASIKMLEKASIPASGVIMLHAPLPARRSFSSALEAMFPKEWARGAKNRFRGEGDINPLAFLSYQYGYSIGQAVPATISNRYISLGNPLIEQQFNELLSTRNCKTFCINDTGVPEEKEAEVNELVSSFLERYFPIKSSFEK